MSKPAAVRKVFVTGSSGSMARSLIQELLLTAFYGGATLARFERAIPKGASLSLLP